MYRAAASEDSSLEKTWRWVKVCPLFCSDTTNVTLLFGEAPEERAACCRPRTVLRIKGNLEEQTMMNDRRPRPYPRISVLSC